MKKIAISPKIIIAVSLIGCFVIGYFVGREHVKYTLRKSIKEVFRPSQEINLGDKPKISGAEKAKIDQEKRDYIKHIRIYNLEYFEYESLARIKRGVEGKLQNIGDRSLKEVVVNFTFLDKEMKPIFEDINKVLIFKGTNRAPIKPNYITDIFYSSNDVPEECSGKFEYKIIDISFWEEN